MIQSFAEAESWMRRGFAALEARDADAAAEIAGRLREMGHSSAFELLAEAFAMKGRHDEAIAVLEEGVEVAPDVWLLWQSLGNRYAQRRRLDDAHRAYERALACPDVDRGAVEFNRALAWAREQRYEEALAGLDRVSGPHLHFKAQSFRVAMLVDAGRAEEAVALARSLLDEQETSVPSPGEVREDEDRARVHSQMAIALWRQGQDLARARAHALQALGVWRHDPAAMWVIRESAGQRSPDAVHWRMTVEGQALHPQSGVRSVWRATYDVVADNAEEALEFIRRFEPGEEGLCLAVVGAAALQPRPHSLKGVYGAGPRLGVAQPP